MKRLLSIVVVLVALGLQVSAQQPPPVPVVLDAIAEIQKAVAAEAAAKAAAQAALEKTTNEQIKKLQEAMVPLPPPVDCVLSAFTFTSATAWEPPVCPSTGKQTRTELFTRTIVTPPANGGLACGPLEESRPAEQTCTPPTTTGLIQKADLVYDGACLVPIDSITDYALTYSHGGTSLAFNPKNNSLFMVGHDWYQRVGEFAACPALGQGSDATKFPRAASLQKPVDILQNKRGTVDGDPASQVKIGGLAPFGDLFAVSAWKYYDAAPVKQTKSHFVTGQNFSALPAVTGPFQVGTGFNAIVPTAPAADLQQRIGGFVSGYMTPIPAAYQAALGGTHLTGQGGAVSILTRTSAGPSASVFTPTDLGKPPVNAILMGYPTNSSDTNSPLHHPTIGDWGTNGQLYNGTQGFRGVVFVEGTRSILFFGWGADIFCYGVGTADPALHLKPSQVPGRHYCLNPTPGNVGNLGTHAYPAEPKVFAYDVNDFIAAKQGKKKPWEVVPYATWGYTLPFQSKVINGIETGAFEIWGAAYDPSKKRLFISAARNEGDFRPVIAVFTHKVP